MSQQTPSDALVLRPATADDDAAILELLAASMGWGDDERFMRFYVWKHHQNPFGRSPAWVAEEDGRLLGLRTWLRWRFETAERTWTAVRAVDTATHPDARGRGIFTKLTMHSVEALTVEGIDFVFNTPNEQSRPGYLKMGWVQLGTLPTAVRFRSPASALRTVKARQPAEKWSLPTEVGQDARVTFADGGAEHWLGLRAPAEDRLRTALDGDVLRWRYGLEDLHYRTIATDDGLAVFRLRRRGPSVEAVVCLTLLAEAKARPVLLRRVAKESGADHVLELTDRPCWSAGMLPLPGQGPVLTWRALAHEAAPTLAGFDVGMGDVELF